METLDGIVSAIDKLLLKLVDEDRGLLWEDIDGLLQGFSIETLKEYIKVKGHRSVIVRDIMWDEYITQEINARESGDYLPRDERDNRSSKVWNAAMTYSSLSADFKL